MPLTYGEDLQPGTAPWVTLDVKARKSVVDSVVVETEVPMDDWIDYDSKDQDNMRSSTAGT